MSKKNDEDTDALKIPNLQEILRNIYQFQHSGGDNDPQYLIRMHRDEITNYITHLLPESIHFSYTASVGSLNSFDQSTLVHWLLEFFTTYFPQGRFYNPLPDSSRISMDSPEITISWRNQDQWLYQVPTYFQQYHFTYQAWTIHFLLSSETANVAGKIKEKRYFVLDLSQKNVCDADFENNTMIIHFSYRPLRKEEKITFKTHYQANLNRWALTQLQSNFPPTLHWSEIEQIFILHLKAYTSLRNPIKSLHPAIAENFAVAQQNFVKKNLLGDLSSEPVLKLGDFKEFTSFLTQPNNLSFFLSRFYQISREAMQWYLQIESVRLALFRKKKFVLRKSYNVSASKVPKSLFPRIVKNSELIAFWRKLYQIDPEIPITPDFIRKTPSLVIDTQFFSFEETIHFLQIIPHLEEEMTGLIIKSENWQALNLLLPRYQKQMQMIYIDPPYNTGTEFIYDDNLARSSWLTLMASRLSLAQQFLQSRGIFFASIDDNELAVFSLLVEQIFQKGKRLDNIVWHKKTQPSFLSKELIKVTEYIVVARNILDQPIPLMGGFGNPQKLTELINIGNAVCQRILPRDYVVIGNAWSGTLLPAFYGKDALQVELQKGPISVTNGIPDQDLVVQSRFKWTQKRLTEEVEKGGQIYIKSIKSLRPTILRAYSEPIVKAPTTLLSKKINEELNIPTNTDANAELKQLFQISPFDYPKPTGLIAYLIRAASYYNNTGTILDFFAGSGTTAHATLDLNAQDKGSRKYVLIEQAASFDLVLKPRIQKIMYSSTWKNGKPLPIGVHSGHKHIFKSLVLEQVEDCYWNLTPEPPVIQFIRKSNRRDSRVFKYLIDWQNPLQPLSLNHTTFEHPFDYSMIVAENGVLKEQRVDLIETFNYLIGLHIGKYEFFAHQKRKYHVLHGFIDSSEETQQILIIIWRDLDVLDLDLEGDFLNEKLFSMEQSPEASIYMNGLSSLPKAHSIEPLFLRKMFNL